MHDLLLKHKWSMRRLFHRASSHDSSSHRKTKRIKDAMHFKQHHQFHAQLIHSPAFRQRRSLTLTTHLTDVWVCLSTVYISLKQTLLLYITYKSRYRLVKIAGVWCVYIDIYNTHTHTHARNIHYTHTCTQTHTHIGASCGIRFQVKQCFTKKRIQKIYPNLTSFIGVKQKH